MTSPPAVALDAVTRRYGATRAVDDVTLAVQPGEFFSLLGPSGCGKTTTLRLIAGLERADGGAVLMHGAVMTDRRPYERPVSMVFQHYALFPHLSVGRNVAFGLEQRRVSRTEIARRVERALALVRLDAAGFAARRPAELSGGQRQRVALARALVVEPRILLLDEPLGALDLQLRKAMQLELKALSRSLGITFVYVTHDQEEALTLSDRIAVMRGGRIVQLGTPAEIYERPRTPFVARFIGECNVIAGATGPVAVRPERVALAPSGVHPRPGTVRDVVYTGERLRVAVILADGTEVWASVPNEGDPATATPWRRDAPVSVAWRPEHEHPLQADA